MIILVFTKFAMCAHSIPSYIVHQCIILQKLGRSNRIHLPVSGSTLRNRSAGDHGGYIVGSWEPRPDRGAPRGLRVSGSDFTTKVGCEILSLKKYGEILGEHHRYWWSWRLFSNIHWYCKIPLNGHTRIEKRRGLRLVLGICRLTIRFIHCIPIEFWHEIWSSSAASWLVLNRQGMGVAGMTMSIAMIDHFHTPWV